MTSSSPSSSSNNTTPGPSLMETLFQRTLDDLIKGIRLHNPGSAQSSFISKSLDEIRREIKSTDLATKSIAVNKLTYLHSLRNIDMSFAAFHAVELTSSPIFNYKKIGTTTLSPIYLLLRFSVYSSVSVIIEP
uniref:AP-3 complex subunit delta n=1 Tax=Tanacetum cinerariifolium TaxID=118510 RepID=A0A699R8Q7_TANCI|nr:AP-3 complex subunit delta [Tanacetum cinerariifolium]